MKREGWDSVIIAASGPSLTPEVAEEVRRTEQKKVIVVNDSWKLFPFANVLYACDARWWDVKGCGNFRGERWSNNNKELNDNTECAKRHSLQLVEGKDGNEFCLEPGVICFGGNSGFQAINLALQFGAKHIILVGYDMRKVGTLNHFFGEHPPEFTGNDHYEFFCANFDAGAASLPKEYRIVNATAGSALNCFPKMSYAEAIRDRGLYCNWPVSNAAAG